MQLIFAKVHYVTKKDRPGSGRPSISSDYQLVFLFCFHNGFLRNTRRPRLSKTATCYFSFFGTLVTSSHVFCYLDCKFKKKQGTFRPLPLLFLFDD
jgi:hypothetical protein